MFSLNSTYKWPYREPDRDYPPEFNFREEGEKRPFRIMSIPGRRYAYRPYSNGVDPTGINYGNIVETGMPPPNARNIRSYTLPPNRGEPAQEPIWIVPPKKEPRFITMEVKEPDPEPIMILPPPPPKQKVIEYEVPVKQKDPEPIMVPVLPPPKEPEYVTVRQVVEEPQTNYPMPMHAPPQRIGPSITRMPDEGKRIRYTENTLLGVRRTVLWELVLASFVLFITMLLIAVFIAGFLS